MHFLTKLLKKIFNRTTVCVIGILLQLTYLVVIFLSFGTQYTYSYFAFVLLGVILSLYIYNMDINPSYKMAWMFAILSFPIFGVMFYVFFGNSHSGDRLRKRMTQYNDEARLLLPQNNELMSALHRDNTAAEKQAKYLYNYGGYPVYLLSYRRGEIRRNDRGAGKGSALCIPRIFYCRRGQNVGNYPRYPRTEGERGR